jgi:BMFP domain-containing protein YqiC
MRRGIKVSIGLFVLTLIGGLVFLNPVRNQLARSAMASDCIWYTEAEDGNPRLLFDFVETSQIVFGNTYSTLDKIEFEEVLREYKSKLFDWDRLSEAQESLEIIDAVGKETNRYFGTINARLGTFKETGYSKRMSELESIVNTFEKLNTNSYASRDSINRAFRAKMQAEQELALILKLHTEFELQSDVFIQSRSSWETIETQLLELETLCKEVQS